MARPKTSKRVRSTSALDMLRRVVAEEVGCSPKDVMRDVGKRHRGGGGRMPIGGYNPYPQTEPSSPDTDVIDLGPTGHTGEIIDDDTGGEGPGER